MNECVRCGSTRSLEKDHIIPKSRGGSDDESNKRFLCIACHDYRHSRDNIIAEIDKWLAQVGTTYFDPLKFTRWIMRLGVLEAFNTPAKILKSGKYVPYWNITTTHTSAWYPQIKLLKQKKLRAQELINKVNTKLQDFDVT